MSSLTGAFQDGCCAGGALRLCSNSPNKRDREKYLNGHYYMGTEYTLGFCNKEKQSYQDL